MDRDRAQRSSKYRPYHPHVGQMHTPIRHLANHIGQTPVFAPNPTWLTPSLFGATVTSWKQDGKERLFVSSKSSFDKSKPVSSDGIAEVIHYCIEGGLD